MIKVESILIQEFRGIRNLTIDFQGKNYTTCGPNGTGKSGVVDALEFALTGNVSRLSGEGRGEVSLKQHGPHVDKRNDPDKALVKVCVTIPNLKKTVTIERSVKNPTTTIITPSDPDVVAVIRKLEEHPEIVLSRRELIKYVLATPGKRAEEVQALLHLDQVEKVRVSLQKIANDHDRQLRPIANAVIQYKDRLLQCIGVTDLTKEKVLQTANIQRKIIGLPELKELNETVSLKDGMATPISVKPQRIPKAQAIEDIRVTYEALLEVVNDITRKKIEEIINDITLLANDKLVEQGIKRETFYTTGLDIIEQEVCPFCDIPWDLEKLRKYIGGKIEHLKEISNKRKIVESKLAPLIELLQKIQLAVNTIVSYANLAKSPVDVKALHEYGSSCGSSIKKLTAFLPLKETLEILGNMSNIPKAIFEDITRIEKVVAELPESSKLDAAREWLTIAQERLEAWRDTMHKQKAAKEEAQKTRQLADIYAATSDTVLAEIYSTVEDKFVAYYQFINHTDEGRFNAKLIPSMGKLGFDVDFYGRGFFPPGAYHSEGHQDSMGLCLYLALMKHLQGSEFSFAVLDDVLMSVDIAHRRDTCTLLKKEFPNTQFIMTTHDPIWLEHMKTEGLIGSKSALRFKSWNVDQGPTQWDKRDVWTELNDYLINNDVRAAASLLRYFLEFISSELCHRLHAQVEFRADSQYQLGELLPPAIARMRKLYKNAKDAANSWNQKDIIEEIEAMESAFGKLADASKAEQWQVNVAIHYNNWTNFGKDDFIPVVNAFKFLLDGFTCQVCNEYFRVSPDRGDAEIVCCECGKIRLNLRRK